MFIKYYYKINKNIYNFIFVIKKKVIFTLN